MPLLVHGLGEQASISSQCDPAKPVQHWHSYPSCLINNTNTHTKKNTRKKKREMREYTFWLVYFQTWYWRYALNSRFFVKVILWSPRPITLALIAFFFWSTKCTASTTTTTTFNLTLKKETLKLPIKVLCEFIWQKSKPPQNEQDGNRIRSGKP